MFSKSTHLKNKKAISPFQALCTALAATVGTGNIAGVASAICIGGAGAVFWMWIAAFFGMMTNYSENVLGIFFRRRNKNGEWSGGAMYYLADGVGSKKGMKHIGKILAIIFSVFTLFASFGIGSMGQVNKIVLNVESAFQIEALENIEVFGGVSLYPVIIGIVIMLLASLIILGGIKRIAAFAEMASCSIPIDSIYSDYSFTQVSSGFMRVGLSNQVTRTHEVFTSKNITVCIRAATNAADFARELINAGLPEAERIPLPPVP